MIRINNNECMVDHFENVVHIDNRGVTIKLKEKVLKIIGAQIQILSLSKEEIWISGLFESITFYE